MKGTAYELRKQFTVNVMFRHLFPSGGWGFRSMAFFVPNFHYVNPLS